MPIINENHFRLFTLDADELSVNNSSFDVYAIVLDAFKQKIDKSVIDINIPVYKKLANDILKELIPIYFDDVRKSEEVNFWKKVRKQFLYQDILYFNKDFPFFLEDLLICNIYDVHKKIVSPNSIKLVQDVYNERFHKNVDFKPIVKQFQEQYGVAESDINPLLVIKKDLLNIRYSHSILQHKLKDIFMQLGDIDTFITAQRNNLKNRIKILALKYFTNLTAEEIIKLLDIKGLTVNIINQTIKLYSNYSYIGLLHNKRYYKAPTINSVEYRFRIFQDIIKGKTQGDIFQKYNFIPRTESPKHYNMFRNNMFLVSPLLPKEVSSNFQRYNIKTRKSMVEITNEYLIKFGELIKQPEADLEEIERLYNDIDTNLYCLQTRKVKLFGNYEQIYNEKYRAKIEGIKIVKRMSEITSNT